MRCSRSFLLGDASVLNTDLVTPRFEVQGGYLTIPSAPGLGVELVPEIVDRYRVE